MTINLYKISADPRALDKITGVSPVNETPITVEPTERVNILNPVFIINYDETLMTCNYLYCDTFDRYYYINGAAVNTAHRLELACSVDVRQSFAAAIQNSKGIILRATSKGSPTKFPDSKLPVNPTEKIITSIELPELNNELDVDGNYCYLLTVMGGN